VTEESRGFVKVRQEGFCHYGNQGFVARHGGFAETPSPSRELDGINLDELRELIDP
jgi:hypothetical protein